MVEAVMTFYLAAAEAILLLVVQVQTGFVAVMVQIQ
jgi:hypothetical protein